MFSVETIKVLQAEDSDTAWAVSKHVISKETEILFPVPFLQELPMAQDAGSPVVGSNRIAPNEWSSIRGICLIGLF